MRGLSCRAASEADAAAVRDVRQAAAADLTARHGPGHWSRASALPTLRKHARAGVLYLVERKDDVVGTFTLSAQKIGFYHKSWFAEPDAPAPYLTNMAVQPELQRRGIGRWTMREIERLARETRARAVRFDAYDAKAGAGGFYRKCGYARVHRGAMGTTQLEYFEKTLP